jgi:membrane protein
MAEIMRGPVYTPGTETELPPRLEWRLITSVRWSEVKQVLEMVVNNWIKHSVPRLSASLAFYTLLSLAPLLIIVLAIASAVFGRKAAEGQLVWQIQDLIGREGAITVQTLLRGAQQPGSGMVPTILGLVALSIGATTVVSELRSALNTIWCVPVKEETTVRSIVSVLVDRTLSFAMVLGIGFLLLVSLAINAALSALGDSYNAFFQTPEWALQFVDFTVTYLVITVLFALLYKLMPDLDIAWRDVALGAALTALLFTLGKTLIGIYLGKAGIASTYGAAGSLVVVVIWVYYSAQIFFFGAEFSQAYAQHFGSRPCDRVAAKLKLPGESRNASEIKISPPGEQSERPPTKIELI